MEEHLGCCHPEEVAERMKQLPGEDEIDAVAGFFRMISDPTRVRILWTLEQGELCVGDISALLNMTVSAISHQLKALKDTGLVKARRQGKHMFYSFDDDHVKLLFDTAVEHLQHLHNLEHHHHHQQDGGK